MLISGLVRAAYIRSSFIGPTTLVAKSVAIAGHWLEAAVMAVLC